MLTRREFVQQATLAISGLRYAAAQGANEVVVKTPSGPLRGLQIEGVRVFRGVPFAQPPVGDLRFRAPQPVTPWKQIRNATEFAASAYQQDKSHPQSEDCLYLNIWAPQGAGPFPVYVWIHGGGFTGGRSFDPMFDGTNFARNGNSGLPTACGDRWRPHPADTARSHPRRLDTRQTPAHRHQPR
ncbi:carboxylesterase family protein [Terriglobus sp. YAF25]|uniref:carboxylesterase family protein n=1 Tax=Terriglobus sp. YAF25 TaxID=3233080 RepID=UPI003F9CEE06